MKKRLLTLALAVSSTVAFAQSNLSPAQVCSKVASINGSNGSICAQIISRNSLDQAALNLAYKAADSGSAIAVEILKASANRRLDIAAGKTCEKVLSVNAQNSIACVNAVLDLSPSLDLLRIAEKLIPQGSAHTVAALSAGAAAYIYAPLAEVCEAMVSVNGANTVLCVQAIANKVSMNGSEQVCRTAISQGSAYALQCVRGIVLDYTPIPQQTAIMVEAYELQNLKRGMMKARAQIDRGMIDAAKGSLEEAINSLNQIMNNNGL